ncbi:MAG: DsbA family protein [Xanthobacteraceae bacterium]
MPAMRPARSHLYVAIAALAIVGYLFYAYLHVSTLTFAPRSYPQGYRDLVLMTTVSQPDPIFGVPDIAREGAIQAKPTGKDFCDALLHDPVAPVAGDKNGVVPLVTFFDYRCPYCKVLAGILSSMPFDNVRVVYHEWAILGPQSVLAARAALAADRQGKYLALHDRLMRARLVVTPDYIDAIAAELGLDIAQLHRDMNAEAATHALQRSAALAKALGFLGTPALIVGRTIAQGEISRSQLELLIKDEVQPAAPKTC